MNYIIREIRKSEIHILEDFLYEAIFIPDWYTEEVPRDIIYTNPKLYAAIQDFGTHPDDYCLVAEADERIVGAVWVGIADEYGHMDNETPSFSISLYKEFRGKGIGTALMEQMLSLLKEKGYKKVSLGVNKENYAVRMYQKVGFEIVGDGADETEWLMVAELSQKKEKTMAFKFGMIGTGHMAERMADTVRQMKDVELYAVAARTEERAKNFAEKYGAEKYYSDYQALMEDTEVQLIYIATPNHLHYEHARACIQHGKPVLVEKPFTLNEQQAQVLIDLAEMNQVFLCEAMWVRFMPLMTRLQKDIEAGRIGEVTSVTADIGYDLKEKMRVNRLDFGGGALLDIGVYPITFALQILGKEIDNISTSMVRMNSGVDAQEFVNLVYTNGAMAGLYATMLSATDKQGKIYGTNGYIIVDDINNYTAYRVYDKQGNLVETVGRPEQISGLEYEVEACVHAIQNRKLECPQMTHGDSLFLMRVLDTVRRTWDMKFPQEEAL